MGPKRTTEWSFLIASDRQKQQRWKGKLSRSFELEPAHSDSDADRHSNAHRDSKLDTNTVGNPDAHSLEDRQPIPVVPRAVSALTRESPVSSLRAEGRSSTYTVH